MTEHETIASALVAALTDLTNVAKAHKANAGKMSYTYASISDLIAETRPVLADHGLVALTPVHDHPDGMACTVVLLHKSGERMDFGPFPFPACKDAQSTGSWVTYVRRYALLAALGMGAEDDDGKAAQAPPRQQQRAQEPPTGITSEQLYERLVQHVAKKVNDPEGEHAKGIWKMAKPKAVNGTVPETELVRVMDVADGYLADLEAVNA